ncbi:hypothetical protein RFI_18954, partial [Reticulomyxa filosa]
MFLNDNEKEESEMLSDQKEQEHVATTTWPIPPLEIPILKLINNEGSPEPWSELPLLLSATHSPNDDNGSMSAYADSFDDERNKEQEQEQDQKQEQEQEHEHKRDMHQLDTLMNKLYHQLVCKWSNKCKFSFIWFCDVSFFFFFLFIYFEKREGQEKKKK